MHPIPELDTPRLHLRAMTAHDWPDYLALMASDHARYMGGPFSTATAWGMFCSDHAQWSLFGCGALMIDDRLSGRCVGQVAVNAGPLFPEFELGWFLYPDAQGQGFAAEAATALRDWARDTGGMATLVSYIDPCNTASIRVAERLGAVRDSHADRPEPDDVVFRHYGQALRRTDRT